uniref:Reverse transcriptase zinc-binding domain-containing protein n=1 Tax=Aegilops tauschii subsp. strangulata TaxID=200361 RepID=A0A453A9D4_AEGTS
MKANQEEAIALREILDLYENCSGQCINLEKSAVMFSPNTSVEVRNSVKAALQIMSESWNDKYLGLPVHVGKSRRRAFAYVKGAIAGRVYGWKEKLIAKVRKETLVTAVAQVIPTFAMSCFDLTKTLCQELSSLIGTYWWSQQDKDNTVHWISWEKLTMQKAKGGLGFRDMHSFNMAMLSRQRWRLIQNPDTLCGRIFKARYFPNCHVWEAEPKEGISYAWRSLLKGLELIREGYIWRIGDGKSVNIWTDPWIPRPWSRTVITPRGNNILQYVNDLIDPATGQCDERLVRETFWPDDVHHILQMPLRDGVSDFIAWQFDPKGLHSVKSAYKLHVELLKVGANGGVGTRSHAVGNLNSCTDDSWKRIWKLPCPRKVQMFAWRIKHESLPMLTNMQRRGMAPQSTKCYFCGRTDEDGAHLFVKCTKAKEIWRELALEKERMDLEDITDAHAMLDYLWGCDEKKRMKILTFWWLWWSSRNKLRKGESPLTPAEVARRTRSLTLEYEQVYTPGPNKFIHQEIHSSWWKR